MSNVVFIPTQLLIWTPGKGNVQMRLPLRDCLHSKYRRLLSPSKPAFHSLWVCLHSSATCFRDLSGPDQSLPVCSIVSAVTLCPSPEAGGSLLREQSGNLAEYLHDHWKRLFTQNKDERESLTLVHGARITFCWHLGRGLITSRSCGGRVKGCQGQSGWR